MAVVRWESPHPDDRGLLSRVPGYLDLLDRYGVAWTERRSDGPGRVVYEDAVQIVAVDRERDGVS